jgi:hypothetical protein
MLKKLAGGKLLFLGNRSSATDAQHLAASKCKKQVHDRSISMTHDTPNHKPKFSTGIITERCRIVKKWAEEALDFATALDWLGDAKQHPEGSEERELAQVRDHVDDALNRCCRWLDVFRRARAETTRCEDLLIDECSQRMGDGHDALHLMRRYHELSAEETGDNDGAVPDTFPDAFAWDTYVRVSALAELAEEFPKCIRHSARQMHGWPMIVSHHLDGRHEFERMAELLEIGGDYPLAVGARKRRGTKTPLLWYLEPLVWRLHVLRTVLIETEKTRGQEEFKGRLYGTWWDFPDKAPTPQVIALLKKVPALPPLTRKTAREWSTKIIVPIILTQDAGSRETCEIPALRNIWRHRSVKSVATFRSRLHSAVSDTLQRFGRQD